MNQYRPDLGKYIYLVCQNIYDNKLILYYKQTFNKIYLIA